MRTPTPVGVIVMCVAALAAGSCSMQPGRASRSVGSVGVIRTDLDVQALAMSMADDHCAAMLEAMRPIIVDPAASPLARSLAQAFQSNGTIAAIDIAAGPNPDASVLDMLVLVTLQRWAFSTHWAARIGEAPASAASQRLTQAEEAAWTAAGTVLSPPQQKALRSLIDAWIAANPGRSEVTFVRFEDFTDVRYAQTLANRNIASGLLKELTEASAVVDSARLLGERALWFAARYPLALGQQAESTAYQLVDQPELRSALASLESAKKLSESLAARIDSLDGDLKAQMDLLFVKIAAERDATIAQATAKMGEAAKSAAEDFDARVNAAREAAVTQTFDRLATERKDLLDDLQSRSGALQEMMNELRSTIGTSTGLAKELTGTVDAIDRVVARFDKASVPGKEPLDIKDVRDAAIEATKAAEKLTILLERTNDLAGSDLWEKRLSQFDHATSDVINRAFWRGLVLVVILLGGLAAIRLIPARGRAGVSAVDKPRA
ncbi:MAG: hypothetical protein ACKVZJ_09680 [Phycisphaerales bacterium]